MLGGGCGSKTLLPCRSGGKYFPGGWEPYLLNCQQVLLLGGIRFLVHQLQIFQGETPVGEMGEKTHFWRKQSWK